MAQHAHRVADCFEIVDDLQMLEALRLRQRPRRERPGAVRELHAVFIDAAGDRHGGAVQQRGHAGRAAAVMLGCMSQGFMGAHGIAAHAMDLHGGGVGIADGDTETYVSSPYVGDESEYCGSIEVIRAVRIRAWKRCITHHHPAPKTAKTAPGTTALSTRGGVQRRVLFT
jgi:hypothetical protein